MVMQFCYVYDDGVAEQRLVALFLRIYEDAGVSTLSVEAGTPAEQRCNQFLGRQARFPFVVRLEGTQGRRVLSPTEYGEWIQHLVQNSEKNVPTDSLADFCSRCTAEAFAVNSSALTILKLGNFPSPAITNPSPAPNTMHSENGEQETAPHDDPMAEVGEHQVWTQHSGSGGARTKSKLGRISVTEAMQGGRERETRLGASTLTRHGTTTR
jgi:hypothetical protein